MGINPIELNGNWKEGFALDIHTISSEYLGEDEFGHKQFDTKRSELGELVYELKYEQKKLVLNKIMEVIGTFLIDWGISNKINCVIPVPPSKKNREFQPVFELSNSIANFLRKPVIIDMLSKNSSIQSKELDNIQKHNLISGSMIKNKKFNNKVNVLLVDDLYKSGETLKEATAVLKTDNNIEDIYVITMTKTRR